MEKLKCCQEKVLKTNWLKRAVNHHQFFALEIIVAFFVTENLLLFLERNGLKFLRGKNVRNL
jgi:hypothetical protein